MGYAPGVIFALLLMAPPTAQEPRQVQSKAPKAAKAEKCVTSSKSGEQRGAPPQNGYPDSYHAAEDIARTIRERAQQADCKPILDAYGARDQWETIDKEAASQGEEQKSAKDPER